MSSVATLNNVSNIYATSDQCVNNEPHAANVTHAGAFGPVDAGIGAVCGIISAACSCGSIRLVEMASTERGDGGSTWCAVLLVPMYVDFRIGF